MKSDFFFMISRLTMLNINFEKYKRIISNTGFRVDTLYAGRFNHQIHARFGINPPAAKHPAYNSPIKISAPLQIVKHLADSALTVSKLIINGKPQPPGKYSAANCPTAITGKGFLVVR